MGGDYPLQTTYPSGCPDGRQPLPQAPSPTLGGCHMGRGRHSGTLRVLAPFCTTPLVVGHRQLGGSEGVGQQC